MAEVALDFSQAQPVESPVTLDFTKAQPLAAQSKQVSLDFSKAQPISNAPVALDFTKAQPIDPNARFFAGTGPGRGSRLSAVNLGPHQVSSYRWHPKLQFTHRLQPQVRTDAVTVAGRSADAIRATSPSDAHRRWRIRWRSHFPRICCTPRWHWRPRRTSGSCCHAASSHVSGLRCASHLQRHQKRPGDSRTRGIVAMRAKSRGFSLTPS